MIQFARLSVGLATGWHMSHFISSAYHINDPVIAIDGVRRNSLAVPR
eukprot:CAMPEP_0114173166 /NCGR_PEP_ID=MMETSP0043_2-20121206/35690_1 /TAXON_ID=464988 /ORGANISM="Hemiselmis andersenii, Strain CCMP644" /LENGTH=46 /DNA_ID= /DNA_START= /DNA_END= /DNA_ORIENTATION=